MGLNLQDKIIESIDINFNLFKLPYFRPIISIIKDFDGLWYHVKPVIKSNTVLSLFLNLEI